MNRYHVQVEPETFQHVDAEEVLVEGGCLIFTTEERTVLALAPGRWITVHEEEAGKTALRRVQ